MGEAQTLVEQILALCTLGLELDGGDGAFSGLKYEGWKPETHREGLSTFPRAFVYCRNHGTRLTDAWLEMTLIGKAPGSHHSRLIRL